MESLGSEGQHPLRINRPRISLREFDTPEHPVVLEECLKGANKNVFFHFFEHGAKEALFRLIFFFLVDNASFFFFSHFSLTLRYLFVLI